MMTCENCGADIPEDNVDRVCAYQVDYDTCAPDYKGAITCNCCDSCRNKCHEGLFENQKEEQ